MNTWVRPILLVEDNPMDLDLTFQALQRAQCCQPDRGLQRW